MSESDQRDYFGIPTTEETSQGQGNGAPDGDGNGQAGGRQATQEESRQGQQGGVGHIVEIRGVVVDIRFSPEELPEIYNALTTSFEIDGESQQTTLEVQQLIGDDVVRTVAMGSTDGMTRGLEVQDTGGPISVPVGQAVLGRLLTCSATRSTSRVPSTRTITGRSTASPRSSPTSPPRPSSS